VDQVEDDVRQIASSMDRLKTLHGERVNAVFEDTTGRDREIEGLSNGITGKFRHAESTLKKIGKAAEPGQELSQSEVKVRMNIQSSMARKIQEMSVRFRQQQKEYLSDVSGQKSGNDMQVSAVLCAVLCIIEDMQASMPRARPPKSSSF